MALKRPFLGIFYGFRPMDMRASSSFINSGFCLDVEAGSCPAATHFLLLRQKKVSKEKATLFVVPSLRYGHAAVLDKSGVNRKLAALKHALALIHFSLRSSPPLQGAWGRKTNPDNAVKCKALDCSPNPNSFPPPVLAGLRSAGGSGNKFLDVRRRRSRLVSKNSAAFEHRKLPEAKRRDPDCGSPFFSLGFFGEAKKSKSPAGASPGRLARGKSLISAQRRQQEANK